MKTDKGHFTHQEILSQPEAWAAALEVLWEHEHDILGIRPAGHFDQAIFTGCGSTYYLALVAAALAQELTGLPSRAFPASELWLSPRCSYVDGRTLLVAVSKESRAGEDEQENWEFLFHGE